MDDNHDAQEGLLHRRTSSQVMREQLHAILSRGSSWAQSTSSLGPSLSFIGGGGCVSSFGGNSSQRLGSKASVLRPYGDSPYSSACTAATTTATTTTTDGAGDEDDDAAEAAAAAYRYNSCALPALHFAIGVINNVQGVAWRQCTHTQKPPAPCPRTPQSPHPPALIRSAARPDLIHEADHGMGLDPADQALVGGVVGALPWNLKIFVAFTSDVLPLCGSRRKAYLLIGMLLQGGAWLLLGLLGRAADLQLIAAQQFCAVLGQSAPAPGSETQPLAQISSCSPPMQGSTVRCGTSRRAPHPLLTPTGAALENSDGGRRVRRARRRGRGAGARHERRAASDDVPDVVCERRAAGHGAGGRAAAIRRALQRGDLRAPRRRRARHRAPCAAPPPRGAPRAAAALAGRQRGRRRRGRRRRRRARVRARRRRHRARRVGDDALAARLPAAGLHLCLCGVPLLLRRLQHVPQLV